jgi:hypothetical protein
MYNMIGRTIKIIENGCEILCRNVRAEYFESYHLLVISSCLKCPFWTASECSKLRADGSKCVEFFSSSRELIALPIGM